MSRWWLFRDMRKAMSRFSSLLLSMTLGGGWMYAQSTTAAITGLISDASGASIPGASITVASESTGLNRQTKSGNLGNYTVSLLPPATYRITVTHDGFRPMTRSGVEVKDEQVARLEIV